jgi:hypothetical protein
VRLGLGTGRHAYQCPSGRGADKSPWRVSCFFSRFSRRPGRLAMVPGARGYEYRTDATVRTQADAPEPRRNELSLFAGADVEPATAAANTMN